MAHSFTYLQERITLFFRTQVQKFPPPKKMFWLASLGHVAPLSQSTVTGGICWAICIGMWCGNDGRTKAMCLVHTYPLFLCVSAMVPTTSTFHSLEINTDEGTWGSQTRMSAMMYVQGSCDEHPNSELLSPMWLKLVSGIRLTISRKHQLALSSLLPTPNLWRKEKLPTVRKWGKVKSLPGSWTDKSYTFNSCCLIPLNIPSQDVLFYFFYFTKKDFRERVRASGNES